MKLDWRKLTRKFLLPENDNRHIVLKKIDSITEQLMLFKATNRAEQFKLSEIIEELESIKASTSNILTENLSLKERILILEENKINEFLD